MSGKAESIQEKEFDVSQLIDAENELRQLKKEYGIEEKEPFWKKAGNYLFGISEKRKAVTIGKKKYCLTALFGGFLGIHQFMVGKKVQGVLYLLLSVTGLSFAMSLLDILYAAFLKTDENNMICI